LPDAVQQPQPAGGLMLLSHADTDLLTLAKARELLPAELEVSSYSLNALRSEDQIEALLAGEIGRARIIVLRVHGPLSCVPGFERLRSRCVERGQSLILISGTGELSPEFSQTVNVPADVIETAARYLALGGINNFIDLCHFLSDRLLLTGYGCGPPNPMPEHGVYLPDMDIATIEEWEQQSDPRKPTAAVLFYRAHRMSGNVGFIDAITQALEARGMNALCIFTSSLQSKEAGKPAAFQWVEGRADVLISTLSFALGEINAGNVTQAGEVITSLGQLGIPVIQAIASGMARGAWEGSRRGLSALDTAINVAIPEFDGRIISVPVSFKERGASGSEGLYVAHEERIERVAGIAARLAALRRTSNSERRVAFVLTNSAAKASQVGGAVGLDTPASLLTTLHAMRSRRYKISALPETSDELMQRLLERGAYDDRYPLDPNHAERFSKAVYHKLFSAFPEKARRRMEDFWGQPQTHGFSVRSTKPKTDKKLLGSLAGKIAALEREPWSDERDYHFAALSFGNALVALQPPRGYGIDPDIVANPAPCPFLFINIDGNLSVAALDASAAAAGVAVREVSPVLHDVQGASIGANHALAMCAHISSAGTLWRMTHTR